jgi:large subunit ribosomal protein L9
VKVIFLKDVGGVGQRNAVKDIADGYALNFLIPQGLAMQATPEKIAEVEKKQKFEKESADAQKKEMAAQLQDLDGKRIIMQAKANKEGHLFKGLRREDIAERIEIDPTTIVDLAGPIKDVGEYAIHVATAGAEVVFTLVVEAAPIAH